MLSGTIILNAFDYKIGRGSMRPIVNGVPQPETPVQILSVDSKTGLLVQITFKQDDFEKFAEQIQKAASPIIQPPALEVLKERNGEIT